LCGEQSGKLLKTSFTAYLHLSEAKLMSSSKRRNQMAKGIFTAQEDRTINGLMRKSIKADTRPVVGFFFLDGHEAAIVARNGITQRFLGKRPRTMDDLHKKVEEGRYRQVDPETGKILA